jgi:hypothetical protein
LISRMVKGCSDLSSIALSLTLLIKLIHHFPRCLP